MLLAYTKESILLKKSNIDRYYWTNTYCRATEVKHLDWTPKSKKNINEQKYILLSTTELDGARRILNTIRWSTTELDGSGVPNMLRWISNTEHDEMDYQNAKMIDYCDKLLKEKEKQK
jgi:hypothetical protein